MGNVKKVRPILQMEKSECGAAALAMVLDYYGRSVPIEELRRGCGVSRNGVNVKNIVKAARYYGMTAKAFRAEIDSLSRLSLPLIIHWNMKHFTVLCGFDKRGAVIADPACGMRTVPMKEFSKSFTGIAIELTPGENFTADRAVKRARGYIGSRVRLFLPYAAYFALIELCAVTAGAAMLFLNSVFIDKILIGGNTQNLKIVLRVLICSGLITAAAAALKESVRYSVSKRLNAVVNAGLIRHILRLPIEFFSQRSEGDLTNRYDAAMLTGERVTMLISPVPGYIVQIAAYLALMVIFDARIAVIGAVTAALNIAAIRAGTKKYERNAGSYSRDMGALQGNVSSTVCAIETIKACGAEETAFERLLAAGTQALNTKTDIDRTGVYSTSLFSLLNALSSGVILLCGVWEILSGSMTAGILIAMQSIAAAMLEPVGDSVNAGIEAQSLKGDAARADDIMLCGADDKFLDETEEERGAALDGDIVLKDVEFGYSVVDEPFIKNFSLTIKKGSRVAITGESGSGKTTVANIIAGLYRQSGGSVTFNGTDIKDISQSRFYSEVAAVSQNIRLFEGSVLENITMWDPSAAYDDVVAAAKAACIHDDIISRRDGYRGRVTEGGANFSGGQRQRIELARALVKKPSVLVMDEATSALDSDTERRVMNNIKALGITTVVVAHRVSAIAECDEIVVMKNGAAVERGTHGALLEKNGAYSALVRSVS